MKSTPPDVEEKHCRHVTQVSFSLVATTPSNVDAVVRGEMSITLFGLHTLVTSQPHVSPLILLTS